MSKNENRTLSSRRTVLKSLGAGGIAAAALPIAGSASPTYNFVASLDFPVHFDDSNDPVGTDDLEGGHFISGGYASLDYIAAPIDTGMVGCNVLGWSCDAWNAQIPVTISWTTDAPSSQVGDVAFGVDVTPKGNYDRYGSGPYIETTDTELVIDEDDERVMSADFDTNPSDVGNVLYPIEIEFFVQFSGSSIYDERASKSMTIGIPASSVVDSTSQMLASADTAWEATVKASDRFVRVVDLEELEEETRRFAYLSYSATGADTGSDIPKNAVTEGISAFQEPVEDARTEIADTEARLGGCGPTIFGT